jgi:hypothetical protein
MLGGCKPVGQLSDPPHVAGIAGRRKGHDHHRQLVGLVRQLRAPQISQSLCHGRMIGREARVEESEQRQARDADLPSPQVRLERPVTDLLADQELLRPVDRCEHALAQRGVVQRLGTGRRGRSENHG